MANILTLNKKAEEGFKDFLSFLLKSEKVKGIFTLKKMDNDDSVSYSFITNLDELKKSAPLHPLMPVNAGKALSRFTLNSPLKEPVAAVLRPCELRAFVELVKRAQGSVDNILLISLTCGGVFPMESINGDEFKKNLPGYWESVKKGENNSLIRPTCSICQHFIPYTADMAVDLVGDKNIDSRCQIVLNTDKGEEFAKDAPGSTSAGKGDYEGSKNLNEKRKEEREKVFNKYDKDKIGIKGLVDIFAACLNCHGCSNSCPICYCTLCEFESKTAEYTPANFEGEVNQKGGVRVPPGTLFFHTGRMLHMGVSCVNCGMCSDVCPVDISVATIFSYIGDSIQEAFEYIPGKNIEEPVPSSTYKEEEFGELGEGI
ncbi:MAG: coenzyme F420 hydrogenase [Candidatus Aminicenantaceae bacterium]